LIERFVATTSSANIATALLLAAVLAWPAGTGAQTSATARGTILVVVSSANTAGPLALAQVRRIFLREVTVWDNGWPITVFERSSDHPIRAIFSSTVMGKTPGQLSEYWLGLALTRGLDPPKVCRTATLLRQYLERVKGGVGYVYEDELESGMLVVSGVIPKSHK
jgi:ABC-type phosphate transport system substrate-binding protein